jgi:MFS family permease
VTFAVQAAVSVALYGAPVMAPAAAGAFQVSPSAVGYFITIAYIGCMMGTLTAGTWVARFGPIRVSQVGLVASLIGMCLAALAPELPHAAAALSLAGAGAFFLGLGYGPTTPASSVLLARAAPPSLFAVTFSIKQTGVPFGGALAGLSIPTLILAIGWQWTCVVIGVGCAALAFAIEPMRSRYDTKLDATAAISLARVFAPASLVLRDPKLRQMAAASFFFGGVQTSVVTYLVTFMTESFAASLVFAGLVMTASQTASVAGRIGWGLLADRASTRRAVLGFLGVSMGVLAILTLAASPEWPRWLLLAFAAALGATGLGWNGVFLAEVARVAPEGKTSEATGGCLFFTFAGVVVTPLIFNLQLALTGSYAIGYAVIGACALTVGVVLLARRP